MHWIDYPDNTKTRMSLHGADYDNMLDMIPAQKKDDFIRDYVRFCHSWIPTRFRHFMIEHMQDRYPDLKTFPLP